MIKSDGKIKTDIYKVIKGSELEAAVTGKLSKQGRKTDKEDIIISILDNGSGQIQEAFVNVNIYIQDIQDPTTNEYVIHDLRVDELSDIAIKLLERHNGGSFRFEIDKQRVLGVQGRNEHCINNRLLYQQCNE